MAAGIVNLTSHPPTFHGTFRKQRKQDCRDSSPVTIIRRTPNRHDRIIKHELVPFHRQLMRASDEVNGVAVRERLGDICAEQEPGTTRAQTPPVNI